MHCTTSQVGTENNVITIQQADFEAFSALDMDTATTNVPTSHTSTSTSPSSYSNTTNFSSFRLL